MSNDEIAASIAALFAYKLESFRVGPFTVALGEHQGKERARVCGEGGDPDSAGSHTLCAEGEDYNRAARVIVARAERLAAKVAGNAA